MSSFTCTVCLGSVKCTGGAFGTKLFPFIRDEDGVGDWTPIWLFIGYLVRTWMKQETKCFKCFEC